MELGQVPKIEKVVVNCGIGDAQQNAKGLEAAMNDLALITGQRPIKTRAKVSLATFKIREGQPLGIAVTLRGNVSLLFPLNSVSYLLLDFVYVGTSKTDSFLLLVSMSIIQVSYHLPFNNCNFVNENLRQHYKSCGGPSGSSLHYDGNTILISCCYCVTYR